MATIDLYCYIPLSVTLTLAGSHKFSTKQILLVSFFPTTLQLNGMELDMVMEQFKMSILRLLLSEVYLIKGNKCDDRCYLTLQFDTGQCDFDLD